MQPQLEDGNEQSTELLGIVRPLEISLYLVWVLGSGVHEENMMYGAFGARWSPFRAKDESLKVP